MIRGQLIIVFFGGEALSTIPLTGVQWAISLFLRAMSLLIGILIRLIPDELLCKLLRKPSAPAHAPYANICDDNRFEWNGPLKNVRDQLPFFKLIRGR
jgi:Ca2+-transporting ATPase